jgi:hypothetical protein
MQAFGQWFGRQVDLKDLKENWQTTMPTGFPTTGTAITTTTLTGV